MPLSVSVVLNELRFWLGWMKPIEPATNIYVLRDRSDTSLNSSQCLIGDTLLSTLAKRRVDCFFSNEEVASRYSDGYLFYF